MKHSRPRKYGKLTGFRKILKFIRFTKFPPTRVMKIEAIPREKRL